MRVAGVRVSSMGMPRVRMHMRRSLLLHLLLLRRWRRRWRIPNIHRRVVKRVKLHCGGRRSVRVVALGTGTGRATHRGALRWHVLLLLLTRRAGLLLLLLREGRRAGFRRRRGRLDGHRRVFVRCRAVAVGLPALTPGSLLGGLLGSNLLGGEEAPARPAGAAHGMFVPGLVQVRLVRSAREISGR